MAKELDKQYNPKTVEDKIYNSWLEGNYFHAVRDPQKTPYTIVIPPPNITGQLHMGHALDNTLQDILIRHKRMQGYAALWLPGTDHASIATEARIVETMKGEGLTKDDLGREGFLERAWGWKREYGGRIIEQLKRLGASCDWERERFTLDEGCNKAVNEVFCNLYEKGLIYRAERIINWCPTCLTSISDAEVEYSEHDGHFWHIRYPLADGSGALELATTRPETMLGDTAVAVHPDDERYAQYIGKMVILPLVGREIPVIADTYVDREFGTGVVKITPAHDPNDFEVGLRHNLPVLNVMTDDAVINEHGGKYEGMSRYDARKAIVKDLEEGGFLVRVEDHQHNVGECYRCGTVVEPRVSLQWFVKMEPLAKPAIAAVKEDRIRFIPDRFSKIYFHWMENIRDWCISRQLWWGHRIPAYYCKECGEVIVSRTPVTHCSCGGAVEQDPDTLDTWFSSALWPFSTLGWPDETEDFKYFYPTNTLVTAYDIIFFWVARMIFSALEQTDDIPFDTVFIHGIIRDAEGKKMSKSLGNGIDPLEVVDEYGADALRMSLAMGTSPGNDMRMSDEKIKSCRNFANKLWNAARFIMMQTGPVRELAIPSPLRLEDRWLLSHLRETIADVTRNLEHFEIGLAIQKVYDFTWDILCDWYIELAKPRLSMDEAEKSRTVGMLTYVLGTVLKLLHPFMPFITEEIWQTMMDDPQALIITAWPTVDDFADHPVGRAAFQKIIDAIKSVRNLRATMDVPPSRKTSLLIETQDIETFEAGVPFFQKLASATDVTIQTKAQANNAAIATTDAARLFIPLGELVDIDKERARLQKERDNALREVDLFGKKLENESFVSRAPAAVVDAERQKLQSARDRLSKIEESLAALPQ